MALEAKLVQKLGQSLTMTPQLQQAIKLLQLGRLEYQEAIERELLENPVLEELRDDDSYNGSSGDHDPASQETVIFDGSNDSSEKPSDGDTPEAKVDWEDYLESFSDYSGASTPKGTVDFDDKPTVENTVFRSETLSEYLVSQIRHLELSEDELKIASIIIGNLDKDGYLCLEHEEIAQECQVSVADVAHVINEIRYIDPVGIGARNLTECLLIQLDNLGLADGIESKIIAQHLDKLEKRKYEAIAKDLGVPTQKIYDAIKVIQSLEPRPGRQFANDDIRYVVPDVYVQKHNGEYVISLNEDGLPKLRVSPYYLKVLQDKESEGKAAKNYLHERLKAASWLIKSIHQRQNTIFRVAESIVKFQKDFLDFGIDKLKPLVLRDVAQDIGMHESTVSRVTTNKYIHTPQGVFELKYFFTTGIKSSQGDMSSSSVKERIRTLIASEDEKKPFSDQDIVEVMKTENIDIARRTVAKYRESLGIPSSSQRKKIF